jgi:hypothetical protein
VFTLSRSDGMRIGLVRRGIPFAVGEDSGKLFG